MNIASEKLVELIGHFLEMDLAANRLLLFHVCCDIRLRDSRIVLSIVNFNFNLCVAITFNERRVLMNIRERSPLKIITS